MMVNPMTAYRVKKTIPKATVFNASLINDEAKLPDCTKSYSIRWLHMPYFFE